MSEEEQREDDGRAIMLLDKKFVDERHNNGLPELREKITVQDEIIKLIPSAGTIALSDNQLEILYAPVKDEEVEIRPDGLVYLPWQIYVNRLKSAFRMAWALIPHSPIKKEGNLFIREYALVIDGKLAGFAFGEQSYNPNNPTMTYGDALEGMKSNALMRLCKGIGISLELWNPTFIKEWKSKHAEQYFDRQRNKNLWRKKGTESHEQIEQPMKEHLPPSDPNNDLYKHTYESITKTDVSSCFIDEDTQEIIREKLHNASYTTLKDLRQFMKATIGRELSNLKDLTIAEGAKVLVALKEK
jgi:hypothetical protein